MPTNCAGLFSRIAAYFATRKALRAEVAKLQSECAAMKRVIEASDEVIGYYREALRSHQEQRRAEWVDANQFVQSNTKPKG